jgi:hypothetical protein
MNAPKDTRPFCLADAKAGAPYACRDGSKAEVLKWDAQGGPFNLIGYTRHNGSEVPESWTKLGCASARGESRADLVMLPLGYLDGKPVFVGDKIINAYGFEVAVPVHSRDFDGCRWPAPAKQYPVTGMSEPELQDAVSIPDQSVLGRARNIANAALRHAIDSGQLPTKEAYDQLRADLLAAEARNAARDMAIAEAVRNACAGTIGYPNPLMQLISIDLAAIIAKVVPA